MVTISKPDVGFDNVILTHEQLKIAGTWYKNNIERGTLPTSYLNVRCSIADIEASRIHAHKLSDYVSQFCQQDLVEMWCAGFYNDMKSLFQQAQRFINTVLSWQRILYQTATSYAEMKYDKLLNISPYDPVCQKRILGAGLHLLAITELYANCDSVRTIKDNQFISSVPVYKNDCRPLRIVMRHLANIGLKLTTAAMNKREMKSLRRELDNILEEITTLMAAKDESALPVQKSFKVERDSNLLIPYIAIVRWDPFQGLPFYWSVHNLQQLSSLIQCRLGHSLTFLKWGMSAYGFACLLDIALLTMILFNNHFLVALRDFSEDISSPDSVNELIYPFDTDEDSKKERFTVIRIQLKLAIAFFQNLLSQTESLKQTPEKTLTAGMEKVVKLVENILIEVINVLTYKWSDFDRFLRNLTSTLVNLVGEAVATFPFDIKLLLCMDLASGKVFTQTEIDDILQTDFTKHEVHV